jgi:hypothetical protein
VSLTPGTTILEGLRAGFGARRRSLHYDARGRFEGANAAPERAELGIAVVGERPYAEWFGDDATLELSLADAIAVERLRARVDTLVVVLVSGRPLVIEFELQLADAVVAAWLPGTEGDGVADVLFGERPAVGTLPYTWPRSVAQLPFDLDALGRWLRRAPVPARVRPALRRCHGRVAVAHARGRLRRRAPLTHQHWKEPPMTRRFPTPLALLVAIALTGVVALATAQDEPALRLADLSDGVPTGTDAFGNGIGFVTWQDGGGALALSAVTIEPGDELALPDQDATEHVLQVDHRIASWGGFTQAFADDAMTSWTGRDLSPYLGLRFWYKGPAVAVPSRSTCSTTATRTRRATAPSAGSIASATTPTSGGWSRSPSPRSLAAWTSSRAARPTMGSASTRRRVGRSASRPARGRASSRASRPTVRRAWSRRTS